MGTRHIGIVGHEASKFTPQAERDARLVICSILASAMPDVVLVSGGCHLGGIDIWAEEQAKVMGLQTEIFLPQNRSWEGGYKARNIQIAERSDELHCIVVAKLPDSYRGMRFEFCYHCKSGDHIKSGGCWTGRYAQKLGKPALWYVVTGAEAVV